MPFAIDEKIEILSKEIFEVFKSVHDIIKDVLNRAGSSIPKFIYLEAGGEDNRTMRHAILEKYSIRKELQTAGVCYVSGDVVSDMRVLTVDHFHPKDDLMERIGKFHRQLKDLGEERVVTTLAKLLQENMQYGPILAKEIAQKLIDPTILKNIYYNCPNNLWPISGRINSAKNDKEQIQFTLETTKLSLQDLYIDKDFDESMRKTMQSLDKTYVVGTPVKIEDLTQKIYEEFKTKCGGKERYNISIFPHYIENGRFCSLLDFYRTLPIADENTKLLNNTVKNIESFMGLAREAAADGDESSRVLRGVTRAVTAAKTTSMSEDESTTAKSHGSTSDTSENTQEKEKRVTIMRTALRVAERRLDVRKSKREGKKCTMLPFDTVYPPPPNTEQLQSRRSSRFMSAPGSESDTGGASLAARASDSNESANSDNDGPERKKSRKDDQARPK